MKVLDKSGVKANAKKRTAVMTTPSILQKFCGKLNAMARTGTNHW